MVDDRRTPARPPATRTGPRPAPVAPAKPAAAGRAAPSRAKVAPASRTKAASKAEPASRAKVAAATRAKVSANGRGEPAVRSASARRPAGRPDGAAGRRALGRVDGGRGQRDGAAVRKGQARARRGRRVVGVLVATVMAVGVMYVALFPGQTLLTQRTSTARAEAELRDVQAQRKLVAGQSKRLTSKAEIEKRAREDFAMKHPGEEIVNILPTKTEPIGLPDSWPFAGVERAFGAP